MFTKAVKYQSFLKMSLSGVAGSGKAQPLDAKILTPTGWRLIGDVRIGDAIINSQGSVSCVLGVYPQGKKEIYRVTLSDGSSTECCDDHLWRTQTYLDRLASFKRPETVKRDGTVKPLHEIRKTLKHGDRANHYLPMIKAIEFEEQVPLAIDPPTGCATR